jgi:hypothetical protein
MLDVNNWPKNIKENILYGEEEIRKLSSRFQINEGDMIRGFREYLHFKEKKYVSNFYS